MNKAGARSGILQGFHLAKRLTVTDSNWIRTEPKMEGQGMAAIREARTLMSVLH